MEFQYKAVDSNTNPISGVLSADSERAALRQLDEMGLTALTLERNDDLRRPASALRWRKKVSVVQKALLIRELATLLMAGVALAEAVESTAVGHADTPLGIALARVHSVLRGGESLTAAFRASPIVWPDYLYQLCAAGEKTGRLGPALLNAADQMEYEERIRNEIKNALVYPAILIASGILATMLIFVVVVPKFASLLRSSRTQIPEISAVVLKAGLFFKDNLGLLSLLVLGIGVTAVISLRDPLVRQRLADWFSRAPLIGSWLLETELGRWSSMLATLLENRVPILTAMELAEGSLRLVSLRGRLQLALRDIRGGKKIAESMAATRLITPSGINLLRVGEQSGELPKMLRTLAQMYENSGRQRMARFLILLEPIAILAVGSVIGFIMISIMMAITSLSNVTF